MKKQSRGAGSGILVLHKTLDILEALKSNAGGLALTDLAQVVKIPKPTAYRIMATLEARGYLDRSDGNGYRVGKKFFDLERTTSLEERVLRAAQAVMDRLVASTKETVNLGILDAGEVVVVNAAESPLTIRMSSGVGKRRYMHSTALGKVLLAGLTDREVLRLIRIKRLPRLTPNTLTTQSGVMAEIRRVRRQGYAMDNEENEDNGRCIGAPIKGPGGQVLAAMSISAPLFRMDLARAKSLSVELIEACESISKTLSA